MEERGDAEEGEERGEADQQQPLLLPLLFCFPVSFCQLSFTGLVVLACTEVDVQKIRTYILPKPALASHVQHKHSGHTHTHKCMYAQCIHTHTHTHLFMSVLMVQSAPEHANDFHYANVCKSDPTI